MPGFSNWMNSLLNWIQLNSIFELILQEKKVIEWSFELNIPEKIISNNLLHSILSWNEWMHRTLNFWLRSTIIVFFWHFLGILLIRPVSIIPRLMNSIFLDRIYQIPPGHAKPFKILPLVSFQKFHSVTLKTMILETLYPFCPSVGLILILQIQATWAPGRTTSPPSARYLWNKCCHLSPKTS